MKTELMSETDRAFRRGLGGWLEHFRAKGWLLPHIEAFLREVCGEGLPAMALNRRVTGVASLCSIYGATRTDLACALCAQAGLGTDYRSIKLKCEEDPRGSIPEESEQTAETCGAEGYGAFLREISDEDYE